MNDGADGDNIPDAKSFDFVVGARGGGGSRSEPPADNEDDNVAAVADDDGNDATAAAGAAAADDDDDDDEEEDDLRSIKDELSISLVTIFLCIFTIAAISWPKDGSPASFVGTLLN